MGLTTLKRRLEFSWTLLRAIFLQIFLLSVGGRLGSSLQVGRGFTSQVADFT